jgi:uroporphyrinogen-III synthase
LSGNLRKETLPEALKVPEYLSMKLKCQTSNHLKYPIKRNLMAYCFSPSAVESYLTNNKIKTKFAFA